MQGAGSTGHWGEKKNEGHQDRVTASEGATPAQPRFHLSLKLESTALAACSASRGAGAAGGNAALWRSRCAAAPASLAALVATRNRRNHKGTILRLGGRLGARQRHLRVTQGGRPGTCLLGGFGGLASAGPEGIHSGPAAPLTHPAAAASTACTPTPIQPRLLDGALAGRRAALQPHASDVDGAGGLRRGVYMVPAW